MQPIDQLATIPLNGRDEPRWGRFVGPSSPGSIERKQRAERSGSTRHRAPDDQLDQTRRDRVPTPKAARRPRGRRRSEPRELVDEELPGVARMRAVAVLKAEHPIALAGCFAIATAAAKSAVQRGRLPKRASPGPRTTRAGRELQRDPSHTVGDGRYLLLEWPAARPLSARLDLRRSTRRATHLHRGRALRQLLMPSLRESATPWRRRLLSQGMGTGCEARSPAVKLGSGWL
jgi:hypothetical protein